MPTLWIDTILDFQVATGAQGNISLMTGVSATQTRFDRMTLLRTILGFDIANTVHDSGEGSQSVSLGVGITSQEAFAAGTLPDPEVSGDFPRLGWIWRARYRIWGFAADQPAVFTRRVDLDLRSQRKLENGEAYLIVSNVANEGSTALIEVTGMLRQLWLVG